MNGNDGIDGIVEIRATPPGITPGKSTSTPFRPEGDRSIRELIAPIAAYVVATEDPRVAVAEVVSELVSETIAIQVAAHRHLVRKGPRP